MTSSFRSGRSVKDFGRLGLTRLARDLLADGCGVPSWRPLPASLCGYAGTSRCRRATGRGWSNRQSEIDDRQSAGLPYRGGTCLETKFCFSKKVKKPDFATFFVVVGRQRLRAISATSRPEKSAENIPQIPLIVRGGISASGRSRRNGSPQRPQRGLASFGRNQREAASASTSALELQGLG